MWHNMSNTTQAQFRNKNSSSCGDQENKDGKNRQLYKNKCKTEPHKKCITQNLFFCKTIYTRSVHYTGRLHISTITDKAHIIFSQLVFNISHLFFSLSITVNFNY